MRTWGLAALALGFALLSAVLSACSGGVPAPRPAPAATATVTAAAIDTDVPAQQALALVPEQAAILTVTDFARVRDQLGEDGQDPEAFWARADDTAPLLARGMFRDRAADGRASGRAPGQGDVLWEAHFTGGAEGYVVRFADDTDLTGLTPPAGAQLRAAAHLLVSGVATDPDRSWASVPGLAGLVPEDAEATYVRRGCVEGDAGPQVEPLEAYSVSFGSTVATARLGPGRHDLFTRMRLGARTPGFARAFADGAADPSSGRIGYRLVDPVRAADLTLRGRLPFAVCAP